MAVYHDRFITSLLKSEAGMAAAIIELDPLPDPVGTTAKNDDFFPVGGLRLVLRFAKGRGLLGRLHIRGARFKFSGASVDPLEDRPDAQPVAHGARSEEHTSELQSLMRISDADFC